MRVMERTIAGILKCAPHFLRQLRRKLNRFQAVADHGGKAMDRLKTVVCNAFSYCAHKYGFACCFVTRMRAFAIDS